MSEFLLRLAATAVIAGGTKWVVYLLGGEIPWWAAVLFAVVLVFGGWLLVVIVDGGEWS